jgi:PAS domain S-box-containing protein
LQVVHEQDRADVAEALGRAIQLCGAYDIEYRVRQEDGAFRWLQARGRVESDGAGHASYFHGAVIDITDRKLSEVALRNSASRIAGIVNAAMDAIITIDAAYRIVLFNPAAEEIFGYASATLIGQPIDRLIPTRFGASHAGHIGAFSQSGATSRRLGVVSGLRANGEEFPIEASVSQIEIAGQKLFTIILRDVTERREAQNALHQSQLTLERRVIERTAQLEAANRELDAYSTAISQDLRVAEAADRVKSAFLATMSHELRTPLNSIIGFTAIVLKGLAGPLTPEQSKQLGMVRGSARHLLDLINDVLDLSKIEAGQLEVHAELFDLRAALERVTASITPLADKKGLALVTMLSAQLGDIVSDRRRVEQIVINLLSNAVKFTERGIVTLTVTIVEAMRASAESASRSAVRIQVTDTGIGIKPANLLTLFRPFRQIDSGLARENEGTGLGLAISQRLATLLGGEISAASEWAQGSTFTLTLPLTEASSS